MLFSSRRPDDPFFSIYRVWDTLSRHTWLRIDMLKNGSSGLLELKKHVYDAVEHLKVFLSASPECGDLFRYQKCCSECHRMHSGTSSEVTPYLVSLLCMHKHCFSAVKYALETITVPSNCHMMRKNVPKLLYAFHGNTI